MWRIFILKKMTAQRRTLIGMLFAAALACWWLSNRPPGTQPAPAGRAAPSAPDGGRAAAAAYCQLCHLLPEPGMLDRRTWRDELLPKMRFFTGLSAPLTNYFQDLDILLAANVFPKAPMMSEETWKAIAEYYVSHAPEKLSAPPETHPIRLGLKQFSATPAKFRRTPPLTTLVKVLPGARGIMMADATFQGIDLLAEDGTKYSEIALGNIPVGVADTPQAFYFAAIGHFFPREEPHGQVLLLEKTESGLQRRELLSNLPRTSDIKVADFNEDHLPDFALCMFGNFIGRFSWFEATGPGGFIEHVLLDKPGALACAVHDFNDDGHADLAVLVAQALESMLVFLGDGKGHFTQRVLFQRQPSWGHSGFELADFNRDGLMDLLVTNGDNADFTTAPLKPYHGVRVFLNRGNLRFEEAAFVPINGAYKAIARDFDQDGDLDVAVISFFPDYEKRPQESFVYLENRGDLNFSAATFPECTQGRWLTMDAADLDGDGDDDIVLGALAKMPTAVPESIKKLWEQNGPSVMILRNNLRQAASPSDEFP